MLKKLKKDMGGSTLLIMVGVIAVIVVLLLAAFTFLALGKDEIAPDQDRDGNGKPDPIIGYIDVSALVEFDNRNWFTQQTRSMPSLNAEFVPGSNYQLNIFKNLAFWNGAEEQWTVKFKVSTDYSATTMSDSVSFTMKVGANSLASKTISSDTTFYVRYNGTYKVTAILVGENGTEIDRQTTTVVV